MKIPQITVFSILCSLLFYSNGFTRGIGAAWSMGFGVKSQSQNNVLEHWDNSLGGYSLSLGLLGMGGPGSGFIEADMDIGFGSFRKYINDDFKRVTGFTSVDLRLGMSFDLTKADITPHMGTGFIFFNGFIPHKFEEHVEENIYKGLGMYFTFGPTIYVSNNFAIIGDLVYAYLGNVAKETYDPMGVFEARIRAAFSL